MENKMPKLWKLKCRWLWNIFYRLQLQNKKDIICPCIIKSDAHFIAHRNAYVSYVIPCLTQKDLIHSHSLLEQASLNLWYAWGNSPSYISIAFISEWRDDLGFSLEIILEACDRAVISTERGRLRYCDGILRKWIKSKGYHKQ